MLEKIADPQYALISRPNKQAVSLARRVIGAHHFPVLCEIGVGVGATSLEFCRLLNHRGSLYLFDFEEKVNGLKRDLNQLGFHNIIALGNSSKEFDSYSWTLANLYLSRQGEPDSSLFHFVFLDGAHVFLHDAPATVILKELLRPGGCLLFDDYLWTLGHSCTMSPAVYPETAERYTPEQIKTAQIRLICDLFMDTDPRFEQIDLGLLGDELQRAYHKIAR